MIKSPQEIQLGEDVQFESKHRFIVSLGSLHSDLLAIAMPKIPILKLYSG